MLLDEFRIAWLNRICGPCDSVPSMVFDESKISCLHSNVRDEISLVPAPKIIGKM